MNLARQDIANTWNGRGVTSEASKFLNLSEKIPTFGREPFSMGEGNNDYLDTIYNESDHMPVATVSKSYALVQHTEIIDAMSSALDNMNFDLNDINCQYNITDYGERMWLKLMFPDQYNMDPGDGNTLRLQMHALNSVDRTIPLIFRIGWFRIICANGMIRLQQGKISGKRHTPSLADTVIEDYIKGHLDTIDDEVKQYQTMHAEKLALSQNFIDGWVDNTLNRKWGVRLAARAHSIITTGYDGVPSRADEWTMHGGLSQARFA